MLEAGELAALGPVQTIALLELGETLDAGTAPAGAVAVPMHDLLRVRELAAQGPTVLVCRHGLRSAALARLFRAEGLRDVYARAGALAAIRPAPATGQR